MTAFKEFTEICETTSDAIRYDKRSIDDLDQLFIRLMDKGEYFATGYMLSREGKVFAAKSRGSLYGHKDEGVFRPDSIRFIASVTKMFTSVAIMQLVEQSRVGLHQPVYEFIDQFDNDMYRGITIFHLLTHTSGIHPDSGVFFEPYPLFNNIWEADDWIQSILTGVISYEPGSQWAYTSVGFLILAEVVSRVSGIPYDQYVMDNIIKPLGMNRTFFNVPEEYRGEVCADSEEHLQHIFDNPHDYTGREALLGGGSLYSTMEDLHTFGLALMNKGAYNGARILSAKTVEAMGRNQLGKGVPTYSYGQKGILKNYGLGFISDSQNILSKGAFGHEGAGRCGLFIDPKEKLVAVYFEMMNPGVDWNWEGVLGLRNIIWSGLL